MTTIPQPARVGGAAATPQPVRTAALWVPDWPVLAAMTAEEVPTQQPSAVHDGRRLTAVSALARSQGVRRGMRRRHAQQCCPELTLLLADPGRDARLFEPVAVAAESVVAGIEVARPGLLLLPATGAGRYHGSEHLLAELLVTQVAEQVGYEAQVGVADGAGAAILAARVSTIVPAGATAAFLAPRGVAELIHVTTGDTTQVADLVDLLLRLGLCTLGDLAGLPRDDVLARFGRFGGWAHRVASGQDDRPTALRRLEPDVAVEQELDPPVERLEGTAFAARRLAEALHVQLVRRGVGCGRLQIIARTDAGQELVRTWRTDTALGGLSVARMTDRVRWQLEGWLTASGAQRSTTGRDDPAPGPLVSLALRAEEVVAVGAEQGRLWGEASGADLRAQRAVHRVQGLIGADAVLGAAVQGGREVRDQVHLVPWGEEVMPARRLDAPWPGRLPAPAPATVLISPEPVRLCDREGRGIEVDARLQLSAEPALVRWPGPDRRGPDAGRAQGVVVGRAPLAGEAGGREPVPSRTGGEPVRSVADGGESTVTGWAGPWPVVQRWWGSVPRRQVYLQATVEDGRALLLALTDGVWTVEAHYD